MEMQSVYVHTESEIVDFINENKPIIFKAFNKAGLNHCEWDYALNTLLLKFAQGKIVFDKERGTKKSTYIFTIAYNTARDVVRQQHWERYEDLDDKKGWEGIRDEHYCPRRQQKAEDEKLVVKEALRRFYREMKDRTKIELLVRYVINGEKRTDLAKEYHVREDFVSLIQTRFLPKLQKLVKRVLKEDERGELKLGDTKEISFLKPYMKW